MLQSGVAERTEHVLELEEDDEVFFFFFFFF